MSKKKIILSILLVLVLVIIIFLVGVHAYMYSRIKKPDKLEVSIKEGTLTRTSATLIMKDTNIITHSYSPYYRIEKKVNEEWQKLPDQSEPSVYPSVAQCINPTTHITELSIDWTDKYGRLGNGEYRIVHKYDDRFYRYIEFSID